MRLRTVKSVRSLPKHAGLTIGYWRFSKKNNRGNLIIYNVRLPDWRFNLAVIGHEAIESIYCFMFGITTEICDLYDEWAENQYKLGLAPYTEEMAFRKDCPYRIGHWLGSAWEYFIIAITFANWKIYEQECNRVMGIDG